MVNTVRYTGPLQHLQGERAIAQLSVDPTALQVQFDNPALEEARGWREMPAHHFQAVPETFEVAHG